MRNLLIKRSLCFILIYLLSIFMSVSVSSSSINTLSEKVDADLYKKIVNLGENEEIDVYIWKKAIDEETYTSRLLILGFDEMIFGDEDAFQRYIVSDVEMFGRETAVKEIRDEYRIARLKTIKSINLESAQEFLVDNSLDGNDVIYIGNYTSTIIITLTKNEIYNSVEDERVLGFSQYKNEKIHDFTNISVDQINAGYGTSVNPGLKDSSQGGYEGTGVSIGIIETGKYDPNSPMLSSLVADEQLEFIEVSGVSSVVSDHATLITSIIVGESKSFYGNTFEGIATCSKVYQSSATYVDDVYTAFNQFLDLDYVEEPVDIINLSGGTASSTYTAFDQEIDNLIYTTKVLFVVSAGNNGGAVYSPARSYNAITVGNAKTKTDVLTAINGNFDIANDSSYIVNAYLSNKPEIIAPGVNIGSVFIDEGSLSIIVGSGTSVSAPHVTGVLAQLLEKYGASININNYVTYFKSRIMLGANSSIINDSSHRVGDSQVFYNKQGAGLVDATNSDEYIFGWNKSERMRTLNSNYYVYIFTPPADFSIRAVLVYEKPENFQILSNYLNNLNLYLENSSAQILTYSASSTNTFELIEYTIPANQGAVLRVHRAAYIPSGLYMSISCFWMGV